MDRNEKLQELSRYYRSPYWNRVRGLLMYQRGGKCEKCGGTAWLQANHVTYDHLFTELSHMGDLLLCCRECHGKIEAAKKRARKKTGILGRMFS